MTEAGPTTLEAEPSESRPVPDVERMHKPVKTLFGWAIFRRLSIPLSLRLARTRIRPWQITTFGLSVGLVGAGLLASGRYAWALAGAGLANLAKLMDAVDGEVARAKHLDSPAGYVADGLADRLRDTAVIVGAGVGAFRHGEPGALAWTLGAAVGYLGFFYVTAAFPSHWREIRSEKDLDEKHMFRLGRTLRLGAGDTLAVGLLVSAAVGRPLWLVAAVAVLAPLAIILKTRSLFLLRPWEPEETGRARTS
jgi:phosphatidylglycerophosphate synthase